MFDIFIESDIKCKFIRNKEIFIEMDSIIVNLLEI